MNYTFDYKGKVLTLEEEACSFFMNDEEKPLAGLGIGDILSEMAHSDLVEFHKEYYDQGCEGCHKNRKDGAKYFEFLEFHYYLYAKDGQFVMSSLSAGYNHKTLPDLFDEGILDASYIISVNVCELCGDYTIDLEYGLW